MQFIVSLLILDSCGHSFPLPHLFVWKGCIRLWSSCGTQVTKVGSYSTILYLFWYLFWRQSTGTTDTGNSVNLYLAKGQVQANFDSEMFGTTTSVTGCLPLYREW